MERELDRASRDWTNADLNYDERFVQAKKECIITLFMLLVHIVVLLLIFYRLGGDYENYVYVLGLPLHIFLMVVEVVIFIVSVFFVLDKVFRHMELDPIGKLIPREDKKKSKKKG